MQYWLHRLKRLQPSQIARPQVYLVHFAIVDVESYTLDLASHGQERRKSFGNTSQTANKQSVLDKIIRNDERKVNLLPIEFLPRLDDAFAYEAFFCHELW